MDKKKSKAFEAPLELVLKATPEVLSPIISTIVHEFESKEDVGYSLKEESKSASSSYRKILVTAFEIVEGGMGYEDPIGIITLQALSGGLTLFRIPPRTHWYITIDPETLHQPERKFEGHVLNDEFNLNLNESYFTLILERMVSEFQRLGFIDFKEEKPPLGFKPSSKETSS